LQDLAFYGFGGLALAASQLMVAARSALHGVLWLVVAFLAFAGLFGALDAHFLAAVQILVYAGAILVLFLFVIMLLNLRPDDVARAPGLTLRGGAGGFVVGVVGFAVVVTLVVWGTEAYDRPVRDLPPLAGDAGAIAVPLFRDALLPFEAVSLLLLAAIVGSVALTKRRLG
jgi:NADH-quinone oxidoreductase subunit J